MKYQKIMARSLPEEVTQGTLEGDIVPGDITFYRLQSTADNILRAYVAEGEVLPVATTFLRWHRCIRNSRRWARFYRHVLIEGNYPHHGAVAFGHHGKALYRGIQATSVYARMRSDTTIRQAYRIRTENPFA